VVHINATKMELRVLSKGVMDGVGAEADGYNCGCDVNRLMLVGNRTYKVG
jgi:hypothetical protein